jgi:hypothetical protein
MRVFVYRNLHKNCLSVRNIKTGLVIAHVDSVTLKNVKFKVSAKGRERVLREKTKNVHAGVEGEWVLDSITPDTASWRKVVYDPYKFSSFVDEKSLEPEKANELAFVTIRGAFVK